MSRRISLLLALFFLAVFISPSSLFGDVAIKNTRGRDLRIFKIEFPEYNFGYYYADKIKITARIVSDNDIILDKKSLPKGRMIINKRLEVVVRLDEAINKNGENRYKITFEYQLFFIPDDTVALIIPEYELKFIGEKEFLAVIPEYPITLSALTHKKERFALALYPDIFPTASGKSPLYISVFIFISSFLLLFAAILIPKIIFYLRISRRSVFGSALDGLALADTPESAFKVVHRAFNDYAGMSCFVHNLEIFFKKHPDFCSVRIEIEEFFALSEKLFFSGNIQIGNHLSACRSLLLKLYSCEKKERRRGHGR